MEEREKVVCMAKFAEQAERYDDMVESMKKLARMDVDMNAEERLLFSVGFKKTIGARRASWRILASLEQNVAAGEQAGVIASQVAKQAVDEATTEINSAGVEGYKDSMLMMQFLKENLALWTSELTGGLPSVHTNKKKLVW
ncbi:hypothetical protein ABZP36_009184 [Zizania latifolia]